MRRLCVAPMMAYTDRHYRQLMRWLVPELWLYTEMIHAHAVCAPNNQAAWRYQPNEGAVALQLGGSDPECLAQATALASVSGYPEINLNVGCPSPKVQTGQFGACLMKQPQRVAECIAAMIEQANEAEVTIKCRLGVDDWDQWDQLQQFVSDIRSAGCRTFIIHARKAWLKGLSPKENRTIPPLNYDWVYQIKKQFPDLEIIINGGIVRADQVFAHLQYVDGVMLGRVAIKHPLLLRQLVYPKESQQQCYQHCARVLQQYAQYSEACLADGVSERLLKRPLSGLAHGQHHAARWRKLLNDQPLSSCIASYPALFLEQP